MRRFSYLCFLIGLVSMALASCAKTGKLGGGPSDKTPPQIDISKSSPNYTTNFEAKKIILVFDEYIELKSLSKHLLISPPMLYAPKIVQRGKKITIHINENEVLREDATYTINFGNSIVDFTVGNELEGYKYVFATGDHLDSITLKGSIHDAFTDDPVVGVYVMLYDILTDSIFGKQRPIYLVKTNDEGEFELNNLRSDTFKVVALEDLNFNYMYDLSAEGAGFLDSNIVLTDSTNFTPKLILFHSTLEPSLVTKNYKTYGHLSYIYNQKLDSVNVNVLLPEDMSIIEELRKDTVHIWYTDAIDSMALMIEADTFTLISTPRDTIFDKRRLKARLESSTLAPWNELALLFGAPIARVDTSKILIYESIKPIVARDTARIDGRKDKDTKVRGGKIQVTKAKVTKDKDASAKTSIEILPDTATLVSDTLFTDSTTLINESINDSILISDTLVVVDTVMVDFEFSKKLRTLSIQSGWSESKDYTIVLMPEAVTGIYGRTNDTLSYSFHVNSSEDYGNIHLLISEMDDSLSYMIELYKKEELVASLPIVEMKSDSVVFEKLISGEYRVVMIEDLDQNQKWSTGDYWKQQQPEVLREFELETLRPNWDLQANIVWKVNKSKEVEKNSEIEEKTTEDTEKKKGPIRKKKNPFKK